MYGVAGDEQRDDPTAAGEQDKIKSRSRDEQGGREDEKTPLAERVVRNDDGFEDGRAVGQGVGGEPAHLSARLESMRRFA
ncbi:hypothetical protein [Bradyrhizobium sp. WD16]|uniref:hypothetical protein n=1 Tax=Bradyrhizobium sp. WD16 TaxID=1521768 RepID=UPI0020A3DADE|nr:hypothetical protein [Bradyrhizobium sp. WD16]UTD26869.1 hypothetical protein DB459_08005 [Bradyrhizobium sp. WD16]